jgi:hypothetical protein
MESGIMVFGKTELDNKRIEKFILGEEGFHAEYDSEFKCFTFEESEDMYDSLEKTLDALFVKYDINARFEGIFENKLGFKSFDYWLNYVINESFNNELRSVTVKYDNGDIIDTDMAAHLTDDEIKDYYKIGKEFNIGNGGHDKMAKVTDVIINELTKTKKLNITNESTDTLNTFAGVIPEESTWTKERDKDLANVNMNLITINDKLFQINDIDFMKANVGKAIRFKYDSSKLYPLILQPKLMATTDVENESSNEREAKYKTGDMVYSWQNPDYTARIAYVSDRGIEDGIDYGFHYKVTLKDDEGYTRSSKWMSEDSLSKTKVDKSKTNESNVWSDKQEKNMYNYSKKLMKINESKDVKMDKIKIEKDIDVICKKLDKEYQYKRYDIEFKKDIVYVTYIAQEDFYGRLEFNKMLKKYAKENNLIIYSYYETRDHDNSDDLTLYKKV